LKIFASTIFPDHWFFFLVSQRLSTILEPYPCSHFHWLSSFRAVMLANKSTPCIIASHAALARFGIGMCFKKSDVEGESMRAPMQHNQHASRELEMRLNCSFIPLQFAWFGELLSSSAGKEMASRCASATHCGARCCENGDHQAIPQSLGEMESKSWPLARRKVASRERSLPLFLQKKYSLNHNSRLAKILARLSIGESTRLPETSCHFFGDGRSPLKESRSSMKTIFFQRSIACIKPPMKKMILEKKFPKRKNFQIFSQDRP
jgi:hypothetical protein